MMAELLISEKGHLKEIESSQPLHHKQNFCSDTLLQGSEKACLMQTPG